MQREITQAVKLMLYYDAVHVISIEVSNLFNIIPAVFNMWTEAPSTSEARDEVESNPLGTTLPATHHLIISLPFLESI